MSFGSQILGHEKWKERKFKHFLCLGCQGKWIFLKEMKIWEKMGPSVTQGIHFSSHFLAFIIKYSNYFLIIVKHLKVKFKENLVYYAYGKGKELISFSFLYVNQTRPQSFFYGKVVDCYVLQRKIISGDWSMFHRVGGGMHKNELRSRNEIYNCVLRLVDKYTIIFPLRAKCFYWSRVGYVWNTRYETYILHLGTKRISEQLCDDGTNPQKALR